KESAVRRNNPRIGPHRIAWQLPERMSGHGVNDAERRPILSHHAADGRDDVLDPVRPGQDTAIGCEERPRIVGRFPKYDLFTASNLHQTIPRHDGAPME